MPTILLARHAQGSFGTDDYDVLSQTGHAQAAALTEDLRRRGVAVDRIVSGTLLRQRDTAAPLAAALGRDVEVDGRWDEYDMAALIATHATSPAQESRAAGADAPQLSSREFQDVLEHALLAWIEAADDDPAPERWPAFTARVQAAVRELAADLGGGETALVCTSGGVIAAACVELLGFEVPGPDTAQAFVRLNRVAVNAAVTKLVVGRAGTTLISFNEHAYLDGAPSLVTYR